MLNTKVYCHLDQRERSYTAGFKISPVGRDDTCMYRYYLRVVVYIRGKYYFS
jgi:hypothetical protein